MNKTVNEWVSDDQRMHVIWLNDTQRGEKKDRKKDKDNKNQKKKDSQTALQVYKQFKCTWLTNPHKRGRRHSEIIEREAQSEAHNSSGKGEHQQRTVPGEETLTAGGRRGWNVVCFSGCLRPTENIDSLCSEIKQL